MDVFPSDIMRLLMIINRQYQEQLPVFLPYPRQQIPTKKAQHSWSVMEYSACKEKREFKKSNLKRLSCHTIARQSEALVEKPSFNNNKILDHILKHIKENYKQSIKQKEQKDIQVPPKTQQVSQKIPDPLKLNFQHNLKIKSINNLIQRQTTSSCNRTAKSPFQNKKINSLRKGKSYTLYTQEVETEEIQVPQEENILPWDHSPNHIYKFPGTNHEDEDSIEENYLKSHHLRVHNEKSNPKCNTLTLELQEKLKTSYKKYSSIQISEANGKSSAHAQMFNAYSLRPRPKAKQYLPKQRRKNQALNRTLTEMRVQIQETQLERNEVYQTKNIKIQQFFQCVIPKTASRKHPTNYQLKNPQSFRRQPAQNFPNNFIMSGKKL